MSRDYASVLIMGEPMKISTRGWDINMPTPEHYLSQNYCMGDQMKYAVNASFAKQTLAEARWEEPTKLRMPTLFDGAPEGAKASLQAIHQDSDDGYDSSHSTACETSDCSESLTSSSDVTSMEMPDFSPPPGLSLGGGSMEMPEQFSFVPPPGLSLNVGTIPTLLSKHKQLSLNDLSWAERANLILPVISGWARILGLTKSAATIAELQRLIDEHPATLEMRTRRLKKARSPADLEKLKKTLEDLRIQELLEKLSSEESPPSVQLSMDALVFEIQQETTKVKRRGQGSKSKRHR
jgi:hypothetical protein